MIPGRLKQYQVTSEPAHDKSCNTIDMAYDILLPKMGYTATSAFILPRVYVLVPVTVNYMIPGIFNTMIYAWQYES